MKLQRIITNENETEKIKYINGTANDFFKDSYNSEKFHSIVDKLNSKDKLTEDEWVYLIEKLYIVTYKAILEEDELSILDNINYIINKLYVKIFKNGKIHDECIKMLAFIECIKFEKEINSDLSKYLEQIKKDRNEEDLDILIRQHIEALIFRDNQDAFLDSYRNGEVGIMTANDKLYMDSMNKAFIREKGLVKEYHKWYNLYSDGDIGVVINDLLIERLC